MTEEKTEANAVSEPFFRARTMAPAVISASRRMAWSVRRELWENRSVYLAPLGVAALFLIGYTVSAIHFAGTRGAGAAQQQQMIATPYNIASISLMGTTFLVALFYCLGALHGERSDRSILFWKSLPVSDLMTVLSKASIPLILIPLLTFAVTVALHVTMLLVSTAVLVGRGLPTTTTWDQVPLLQMWTMLLYHLLAIHGLWYAPIYGWLLLVSGWARRVVFLWAVLPLLAIGVVEKIAFNTTHFGALLMDRLGGGPEGAASMGMDATMQLSPGRYLMSPGLWIGLAFLAVCLAGAVRLRRARGPM